MTDLIKYTGVAGIVEIGARKLRPGDILSAETPADPRHVAVSRDTIDELCQRGDFTPIGNVKPATPGEE